MGTICSDFPKLSSAAGSHVAKVLNELRDTSCVCTCTCGAHAASVSYTTAVYTHFDVKAQYTAIEWECFERWNEWHQSFS